ncbi:MAG: alpha/beta hydrolase [Ideonella sp.]|nr:alpha/beta hydrolase [Ideonella sp.]
MPTPTALPTPSLPIRGSDLRGLVRLGIAATLGVTDLVEAMHHTIASGGGIVWPSPRGRTSGITGFVYGSVRAVTRGVGRGVDALLGAVSRPAGTDAATPQREALIGALNGIWGDHLAATGNPLAVRMALRMGGRALDLSCETGLAAQVAEPRSRLLVLAHGLCMGDLQWTRQGHDHGQALARDLGYTPVYLNYNSGRHVSQNGREFSALLEQLVARWPVPVDELAILGHSMGGLVARSACHHAGEQGQRWLASLSKLVFLGTPHHGAPLERGGRLVDAALGLSPYVRPFARLGKTRSAGITDLRFGNLQDADWQGRNRHSQHHDDRRPTPLPQGVQAYLLAASLAERPGRVHRAVIGDGLVPLASALGEHRQPELALAVPASHRHVVSGCGHLDLLCRDEVSAQLHAWLA